MAETYDFSTDAGSAYSNFVGNTPMTPANTYTAASYGYTPAPSSSGTNWTSWIAPTLNGLTGLAGSAANIYSAATGRTNAAPRSTTTIIGAGQPAGVAQSGSGISTNVLLIVGGVILAAVLLLPALLKKGK